MQADPDRKVSEKLEAAEEPKKEEEEAVNREEAYCRFCWVNEHTLDNPLIASCSCSGGVKFVHFLCLRQWIQTKMISQILLRFSTYFWPSFECEICKTPFPFVFKANGRKYNMVEFQIPENENFLVLESLNLEKSTSKLVHILTPKC